MTAAERLKAISGAGATSAGARLRRIGGAALTAGALLVSHSGLPSATAAAHLLVDRSTTGDGAALVVGFGGQRRISFHDVLDEDNEAHAAMSAALMVIVALAASGELD